MIMNKTDPGPGVISDFDHESTCKYFLYRTLGSNDQQTVESGFKVQLTGIKGVIKVIVDSLHIPD